jgi:hypothetical protein
VIHSKLSPVSRNDTSNVAKGFQSVQSIFGMCEVFSGCVKYFDNIVGRKKGR